LAYTTLDKLSSFVFLMHVYPPQVVWTISAFALQAQSITAISVGQEYSK